MPRKQAAVAVASAPKKKSSPTRVREERKKTRKDLDRCSDEFSIFKPMREVLTAVRSVPTIFCQLDHALGVGGFPIERFVLVHGPSNQGKTLVSLGLVRSFLQREHFAGYIDAEMTTPIDWVDKFVGADLVNSGRAFALRPSSYEETIDGVREFVNGIAKRRAASVVHPDTSAILIVDSLKKLVPADFLKRIEKEGAAAAGADGMRNRGAQIKAKMNADWLDELTPLLYKTRTCMVAIEREADDPDADTYARKWGRGYKVLGGKAPVYDASAVLRCERASWVYAVSTPTSEDSAIGEKIRVTVKKTKIAGKEDREAVGYFYSSNGTVEGVPEGFDVPRDLIEFGKSIGVIELRGASHLLGEERLGVGEMNAVRALHGSPELFARVEAAVRARMKQVGPGDGVVVG